MYIEYLKKKTKLKSFALLRKPSAKNNKKRNTEWEKIFENYMPDKGLIVNIFKQLIQLNIKKNFFK